MNGFFTHLDLSGSDESSESVESHETKRRYHPLFGADNKCTFGPTYWCSSEEAMKECHVSVSETEQIT